MLHLSARLKSSRRAHQVAQRIVDDYASKKDEMGDYLSH